MNRSHLAALSATVALAALAARPSAAADVTIGDAGETTGIRVDQDGVLFLNCGIGNRWENGSMDLFVPDGGDNLADADFQGTPTYHVPYTCYLVGVLA